MRRALLVTALVAHTYAEGNRQYVTNSTLHKYVNHSYYDVKYAQESGSKFTDICDTGRKILVGVSDWPLQRLWLPFTYSFYGHPHDDIWINPNGFLQPTKSEYERCGDSFCDWGNSDSQYKRYIAPLMADFMTIPDVSYKSGVYYQVFSDRLLVQWNNVVLWEPTFNSTKLGQGLYQPFTFQVEMRKSGTIVFHYKTVPIWPAESTVQRDGTQQSFTGRTGIADAAVVKGLGYKQTVLESYLPVSVTKDHITRRDTIVFEPMPTCASQNSCTECGRFNKNNPMFQCHWCHATQSCTDGIGRDRLQVQLACAKEDEFRRQWHIVEEDVGIAEISEKREMKINDICSVLDHPKKKQASMIQCQPRGRVLAQIPGYTDEYGGTHGYYSGVIVNITRPGVSYLEKKYHVAWTLSSKKCSSNSVKAFSDRKLTLDACKDICREQKTCRFSQYDNSIPSSDGRGICSGYQTCQQATKVGAEATGILMYEEDTTKDGWITVRFGDHPNGGLIAHIHPNAAYPCPLSHNPLHNRVWALPHECRASCQYRKKKPTIYYGSVSSDDEYVSTDDLVADSDSSKKELDKDEREIEMIVAIWLISTAILALLGYIMARYCCSEAGDAEFDSVEMGQVNDVEDQCIDRLSLGENGLGSSRDASRRNTIETRPPTYSSARRASLETNIYQQNKQKAMDARSEYRTSQIDEVQIYNMDPINIEHQT